MILVAWRAVWLGSCFVAGALALTPVSAGAATEVTACSLGFEVVAENAIGDIAPGERLRGTIDFTIQSAWQQDEETVSYRSKGTIRLGAAGRGAVAGEIRVVHVIRTPYTADYISIDAAGAAGDLGGQQSYADPMLVTLYAAPGTLPSSAMPRSEADWNVLSKRRVFQVHTPTAMQIFTGPIDALSGNCR